MKLARLGVFIILVLAIAFASLFSFDNSIGWFWSVRIGESCQNNERSIPNLHAPNCTYLLKANVGFVASDSLDRVCFLLIYETGLIGRFNLLCLSLPVFLQA